MYKCMASAVFGLLLMAAPGAMDYGDPVASLHYTVGPLIVSFSIIGIWEPVRGARFVNLPLAAAVVAATPILTLELAPLAAALVAGIGSVLLSVQPNDIEGRYGGGWWMLVGREK
jgi:hypothetical protein